MKRLFTVYHTRPCPGSDKDRLRLGHNFWACAGCWRSWSKATWIAPRHGYKVKVA